MKNVRLSIFLLVALQGCVNSTGTLTPAGPAAWSLVAGASDLLEAYQGLNFYPTSLTIDAGDTVTWTFPAGEPHTVTFLGPRTAPPPPTDPSAPMPAGGSLYDASTYTSSGFVLLGRTYSLTFTRPGTYQYYCLLHNGSGMVGTITVNPARTPYPQTQSGYATQGSAAIAADLANAAAAVSQFPFSAGGTRVAAGISAGLIGAANVTSTVVRFINGPDIRASNVTVSVGGTVTWTNESSNFPHTVTFGIVGQPFPNLNPFAPPSGLSNYDGTALVNSGPLFPGQSFSLKFTKAGTYTYHCILHDDTENMIATVTVQ